MIKTQHKGKDLQRDSNVSRLTKVENQLTSSCSGCSMSFYPLTKLQTAFSAIIIIVTWLYMFYSSMRLLWLRKHSNNVFVRCSALWRFILITTIFHMVAMLLYVGLCFVDVSGDVITFSHTFTDTSNSIQSEKLTSYLLANSNLTSRDVISTLYSDNSSKYLQIFCYVTSHSGMFLSLSSIFLLLHSSLAPLLYLLRLLGMRRLISFL